LEPLSAEDRPLVATLTHELLGGDADDLIVPHHVIWLAHDEILALIAVYNIGLTHAFNVWQCELSLLMDTPRDSTPWFLPASIMLLELPYGGVSLLFQVDLQMALLCYARFRAMHAGRRVLPWMLNRYFDSPANTTIVADWVRSGGDYDEIVRDYSTAAATVLAQRVQWSAKSLRIGIGVRSCKEL
jgi:hypothetical protein